MSKHRVLSAIENTRTAVSSMIPTANDLRNLPGSVVDTVKQNPIGTVLSAFAIGFLAGSLLPSTRVEDDRLGALKGTLQTQAKAVGSQALEHGKAVIRDTIEAAQYSAQEHGMDFVEEIQASGV